MRELGLPGAIHLPYVVCEPAAMSDEGRTGTECFRELEVFRRSTEETTCNQLSKL